MPQMVSTERKHHVTIHTKLCQCVYKVVDANGQVLAYVYGLADSRDARIAKSLTRDEARRIASNIAKLPSLLGKGS
jgi:hypothetical protein